MKYIVVTGGVISGLGKGITASSVGVLLKGCGLSVTSIKIDPYLNIDAGMMALPGPSFHAAFKKAVFTAVPRSKDGVAFNGVPKAIAEKVPNSVLSMSSSALSYTPVVKLDLEARGYLGRVPGKSPQPLCLLD